MNRFRRRFWINFKQTFAWVFWIAFLQFANRFAWEFSYCPSVQFDRRCRVHPEKKIHFKMTWFGYFVIIVIFNLPNQYLAQIQSKLWPLELSWKSRESCSSLAHPYHPFVGIFQMLSSWISSYLLSPMVLPETVYLTVYVYIQSVFSWLNYL